MMKTQKKQSLSALRAFRRTAPMIIKAFPFTSFMYVFVAALMGIASGIAAPVNQILYDALADVAGGVGTMRIVYIGAAFVAIVMLSQRVLDRLYFFVYHNIFFKKVEGLTVSAVNEKLGKISAQVFEDKDRLDDIEKACRGSWRSASLFFTFTHIVFYNGLYYVVVGIYLWSMRPLLLIALAFIFTPVILSQIVQARIWAKLEHEVAPYRRQFSHYEDCLIGKDKLKETRLFGVFNFFRDLYTDTLTLLQHKEWNVHKKIAVITLGLGIIKSMGFVGVMVLLFDSLRGGYITVGAFAAVFTSIGMMFGMIEGIISYVQNNTTQFLGQIHNFINLLDMEERQGANNMPDFSQGVVATGVSFAYPKADNLAIDDVSLRINPGETIALVGENGSGKTTLVKMLMGLYTPDSGQILVGGQDVSTTCESALFAKTSAVFQNYKQYIFSLSENVQLSDYDSDKDVTEALRGAAVDYTDTATFPDGLETALFRDFGGVDISGGQMQRIAMARGMYRRHQFIVLDEPTAAIDPLEETRVYKQFTASAKDKTAILVTHRLGSARIADRILVMDGGKIVESGAHEELLGAGGVYAQMWEAQAERYVGA